MTDKFDKPDALKKRLEDYLSEAEIRRIVERIVSEVDGYAKKSGLLGGFAGLAAPLLSTALNGMVDKIVAGIKEKGFDTVLGDLKGMENDVTTRILREVRTVAEKAQKAALAEELRRQPSKPVGVVLTAGLVTWSRIPPEDFARIFGGEGDELSTCWVLRDDLQLPIAGLRTVYGLGRVVSQLERTTYASKLTDAQMSRAVDALARGRGIPHPAGWAPAPAPAAEA